MEESKVLGAKVKCSTSHGNVMVECFFDKPKGLYYAISDTGHQAHSTVWWSAVDKVIQKMNGTYLEVDGW